MRLEDALKLVKGTTLEATASWFGPEKVTKGKTYVMQSNTRPVWPGRGLDISYSKLGANDKPVNAELPIIDDEGRLVYPVYLAFKIVQ